jgi:putative membrane protein
MGRLFGRWFLGRGRLVGRRRRIGELVMPLTENDRTAIAAAIREAEKQTCGQIVCVLARAASDYSAVPIEWAAVLALTAPWPLIYFTQLSVQRIFSLQLAVFILAALILSWSPLRMAIVPRAVRRARAHRGAIEQFFLRGLANTRHRCGVLIFASMAEHYARSVADEGVSSKVAQSEWQAAVDELIRHMRDGQIAEGFIAAIERCSTVLAAHAPPVAPPDELPDRIFILG